MISVIRKGPINDLRLNKYNVVRVCACAILRACVYYNNNATHTHTHTHTHTQTLQ